MHEIVSKVIEAEQQAEKALAEARQKAAAVRSAADAEAASLLQAARAEAQVLLQESLARSRESAEAERLQTVRDAQDRADRFPEDNGQALGALVDRIVALIIAPGYQKG